MNTARSVVVTGLGAAGAFGKGADVMWRAVLERRTAGASWKEFSPGSRVPAYAAVEPRLSEQARHATRMADRSSVLCAAAVEEALADARLDHGPIGARGGVVIGTARGPVGLLADAAQRSARGRPIGPAALGPSSTVAAAGVAAILAGTAGPCMTVSAACASGATAIATGAMLIACGAADVVIAGGADALLHGVVLEPFDRAGLLASHEEPSRALRPFDARRNGTVLGEGAGVMVLESHEHAHRRSARPIAVLAGWALAGEPAARVNVDETGETLAGVMRSAAHMAGCAGRVGLVWAHATGTVRNDAAEARAIRTVFGESPRCCASKPVTGHCGGATAAMEAVLAVRALREGVAPPIANLEEPDPECAVNSPARPESWDGHAAVAASLGFWGCAAALCFVRAAETADR